MTMTVSGRRPLSVTLVACLYIVMGTIGFLYHLAEFDSHRPFDRDFVWVELVRLLAVVAGVFMLRRQNWARWLALAWMGYHVVLSAFHTLPELLMHAVFFVLFAWLLWTAPARRYFEQL
jgi:hypothetical protein